MSRVRTSPTPIPRVTSGSVLNWSRASRPLSARLGSETAWRSVASLVSWTISWPINRVSRSPIRRVLRSSPVKRRGCRTFWGIQAAVCPTRCSGSTTRSRPWRRNRVPWRRVKVWLRPWTPRCPRYAAWIQGCAISMVPPIRVSSPRRRPSMVWSATSRRSIVTSVSRARPRTVPPTDCWTNGIVSLISSRPRYRSGWSVPMTVR